MRQNGHHKYIKFRKRFPYFRFVDYKYVHKDGGLDIRFIFNLSGKYTFTPSLKLEHRSFYDLNDLSGDELNNLVFHLGMIELISYWKLTCSPKVIIEPHKLSQEQVNWWKKLYLNGLGEFFYLNGINPDPVNFMKIDAKGGKTTLVKKPLNEEKVIVPVGGGKDSVVTLELLKNTSFELYPMMLNPRPASMRTVEISGYGVEQSVVIQRTLDPLMPELNKQGFLNGHTPFSALLAFVNVLAAAASGVKYIALSNENSANESTVPGTNINHQYSKSFEFEQDFAFYCKKYIHPDLAYFSFLRPLNELQIGRLFAQFPQHFDSFRSCNVGSKNDSWCATCPKCLFTQIILSPFIPKERLQKIFHTDLTEDVSLKPVFDELTGTSPIKPFECVGTPDEVNTAITQVYGSIDKDNLPALFKNYTFPKPDEKNFERLIHSFNSQNRLPASFLKILMPHLSVPVADRFILFLKSKFGASPEILILGFGKEGQSTYKVLRLAYPDLKIHVADRNEIVKDMELLERDGKIVFHLGKDYQSGLDNYPVIIKSPGVKLDKIPRDGQISSQTDLFLEFYGDQTIGVTGTKGKSTTSSLIHHLLQASGRKTLLLGNIGIPPFDMTDRIVPETTIVFEMSAHQLENVHHAPHIAVLLNIFPEHLDYFGDFGAYRRAKYNIFKYQKLTDVAIVHQQFAFEATGKQWLFGMKPQKDTTAFIEKNKLIFTDTKESVEVDAGPHALIGQHNLLNVIAALLAIRTYDVSMSEAAKHISTFVSLPHRLEFVGRYQGIDFYNDSISTVPESTLAAVQSLSPVKTLILGGYDRGLNFREMVQQLERSEIEHFIFLGKAGRKMCKIFEEISSKKSLVTVKNMEEAVVYALDNTDAGVCLLSPAAASYDQFHNFEHRGKAFKDVVERYTHKKGG